MSSRSTNYQSSAANSGISSGVSSSGFSNSGVTTSGVSSGVNNTGASDGTTRPSQYSSNRQSNGSSYQQQSQQYPASSSHNNNRASPSYIAKTTAANNKSRHDQQPQTPTPTPHRRHHLSNVKNKFNIFKINLVKVNEQDPRYAAAAAAGGSSYSGPQYLTYPEMADQSTLNTMTQYPHYDSSLNSFYYYHYYNNPQQNVGYQMNPDVFYPNPYNPNLYYPTMPITQPQQQQTMSTYGTYQRNQTANGGGYYYDIDPNQNQFQNIPIDYNNPYNNNNVNNRQPIQTQLVPRSPSKVQQQQQYSTAETKGSDYGNNRGMGGGESKVAQENKMQGMVSTIERGIQNLARLLAEVNEKKNQVRSRVQLNSSVVNNNASQYESNIASSNNNNQSNISSSRVSERCSCSNAAFPPNSACLIHPNTANIQRFNQLLAAFKELTQTLGPNGGNISAIPSEIPNDGPGSAETGGGGSKIVESNSGGPGTGGATTYPSNMVLMDRKEFEQKMNQMEKMVKEIEQVEYNLHSEMMAGIELK